MSSLGAEGLERKRRHQGRQGYWDPKRRLVDIPREHAVPSPWLGLRRGGSAGQKQAYT